MPDPGHGRAANCVRTVLLLALLLVAGHGAAAQQPVALIPLDERAIRSTGIEWAQVEPEATAAEISLPATVAIPPHQLRVVAAPVGGLIEALLVAPDEQVTAGEPLARLRSTELLEAQRLFLEAINSEALARERLRRDEALARDRVIAERRLLVTRAEHVAALTAMQEREQMLSLLGMQQAELDRLRQTRRLADTLTVTAPSDGITVGLEASPGQRVTQSAPLFSLAVLEPLWVNIQVPLTHAAALQPGVRVVLPTQGAEGQVLRLSRRADAGTQSVTAVAEITEGAANLRPGEAVTAVLPLRANGNGGQWRVPPGAVVRHRDRNWVFVRHQAGFEARPVTVLADTAAGVSVSGAMRAGDAVVTRGVLFLLGELAEREGV